MEMVSARNKLVCEPRALITEFEGAVSFIILSDVVTDY